MTSQAQILKPQYLPKYAIFLGKKTCSVERPQHFGIQFGNIWRFFSRVTRPLVTRGKKSLYLGTYMYIVHVHPSADCVVGWTTLSASGPGPLGRQWQRGLWPLLACREWPGSDHTVCRRVSLCRYISTMYRKVCTYQQFGNAAAVFELSLKREGRVEVPASSARGISHESLVFG